METDGPRHSVSVSAVIVSDADRVLAIRRRDNGHWEPPGGVLELDEPILEGLAREVAEETGLVVEPERLTGVYKNMVRGIVALVFRCRVVGGDVASSAEVSEAAWLSPAQVGDLMSDAYSSRVADALADAVPAIRTHDGERLLGETATASPRRAR
jgi:ADP-ribose pyrophosphatase YjhB (NUDIX family)